MDSTSEPENVPNHNAAVVESTFVTEFEVTGDPDDVDDHSVAEDCTVPCYAMALSRGSEQIQDTRRGSHSSHFTQSSLENNPPMEQCVVAKVLDSVVSETALCNPQNGVVEHTEELENSWPYSDTELCSSPKDDQVIILGKGGTDKSFLADGGSPESATAAIATFESVLQLGAVNVADANDRPLQCSFSDSVEHAFSVLVIASPYIDSAGCSGHHSSKEVSLLINDKDGLALPCTSTEASYEGTTLSRSVHVLMGLSLSALGHFSIVCDPHLACFDPGIAPMPPDRLLVSFRVSSCITILQHTILPAIGVSSTSYQGMLVEPKC